MAGEDDPALEALRFDWGEAYVLGSDGDGYWALRRDGLGGKITAGGADELRKAIREDYELKKVPRGLFPPTGEPA
jgi:hypothetical protein